MKNILLALAIFMSASSFAQVTKVNLQASGLTCSMCSNSINKALKTLPYVDKVAADIKTSSFEITFKPGAAVHFDDLKKKVEDAGFFIARLTATMNFASQQISNDEHIVANGVTLHFLHVKDQAISGYKTIQVIDKGYVPAKEYKKNGQYTKMACYNTGVMEACCSKGSVAGSSRIYHVTI